MNALLVGGNRFVGVDIAWQLLRAGYRLTILALDAPPQDLRPHVQWIHADRNNEAALRATLAQHTFEAVIDNIAYEPHQIERLAAALNGRIGRYLLTSTADVYTRNHPRTWREDEADIRSLTLSGLDDNTRYSWGKRSCEAALRATDLAWTVVRPCVVSGVRDNVRAGLAPRGAHWFEEAARSHFWPARIQDGGPILLSSEDECVWQMIWSVDLARAITQLLREEHAAGEAYNVAGDEIWTNERLVRAHAAGVSPEIVHASPAVIEQAGLDYRPVYGTGASWSLCDNAKLKTGGWRPTPAEQWLPSLMEARSEPAMRMWYHARLQEIALARRIQRRTMQGPRFAVALHEPLQVSHLAGVSRMDSGVAAHGVKRVGDASDPNGAAVVDSLNADGLLPGRLSAHASASWRDTMLAQSRAVIPRAGFYRAFDGAVLSGIGVGTWMGPLDTVTDQQYVDTLVHAACRGLNVFDTAINYRNMRAERCVGRAIRRLTKLGMPRDAMLVSTKGGYITHDCEDGRCRDAYVRDEYLAEGLIDNAEAMRSHSLQPRFIERQIEQSLRNLGLETIDVYFLHNPEEALASCDPAAFVQRLTQTFGVLERAVAAGKIGCYGLATWEGLRVAPGDPRHLRLEAMLSAAGEAARLEGYERHHLRVLQLPFNVRDHEAATLPTQVLGERRVPVFEAAAELGLYCFTSATVLQGMDIPNGARQALREAVAGHTDYTAALHAACNVRGVGTALVGMRRIASVEEAIAVANMDPRTAPTVPEAWVGAA